MRRSILVSFPCAIIFLCVPAASADDPIKKRLDAAKETYAKEADTFRAAVAKLLEDRLKAARDKGDKKAVDQVKAEQRAFEEKGELPKATPVALKTRLAKARETLETAFATAVKDYTKAAKDDEAAAAEKHLEDFKAGRLASLDPVGPSKEGGKWISLFNGKDLTGWKPMPRSKAEWRVDGGTLRGSGGGGFLFLERNDLTDFRVRVEARISDGGNGGVFVRTPDDDPTNGYEGQINSSGKDPNLTGSIYLASPARQGCVAQVRKDAPQAGKWFTLEVVASGSTIAVWVDGKKRAEFSDERKTYLKGGLSLQLMSGEVSFRKIEVLHLDEGKK